MRLQILDDVHDLRTLLVTSLAAFGFDVHEETNGDLLLGPSDRCGIVERAHALSVRSAEIPTLICGNVQLDILSRDVRVNGRKIALGRREIALLAQLLGEAGRTVLRATLEASLYGRDRTVTANALEASVSRLRHRLRNTSASVQVETRRGIGYRLVAISRRG